LKFEAKTNWKNKAKNRTNEHLNYSIAFYMPDVVDKGMKR